MRDPDLVHRAQLAATALEGAWHRWRVVHGLAADPTPAVSSYVGYSLDEPWGQPRIVFGLAAQDAEQLAALLDRHDCVGPVHAAVATLSGARDSQRRPGPQFAPLPVPRQAATARPQAQPGPSKSGPLPSAPPPSASPAARPSANGQIPGPSDARMVDYDEPLFRQAAAAMADLAAVQEMAGRRALPDDTQEHDFGFEIAAVGLDRADLDAAETGIADHDADDRDADDRDADDRGADECDADDHGGPEDRDPDYGDFELDVPMGALARAATAARAEAEARIRAVRTDQHDGGPAHLPPASEDMVMPAIQATDVLEPLPRPEAASGAYIPSPVEADALTAPDLDGHLDGHLDSDEEADHDGAAAAPGQAPAGPPAAATKRGKAARGYQIPRLSRTKRPGAVPDTTGAGS